MCKESGRITNILLGETGYEVEFTDGETGEFLRTEHYDELPRDVIWEEW